jgi:hypothetical protein
MAVQFPNVSKAHYRRNNSLRIQVPATAAIKITTKIKTIGLHYVVFELSAVVFHILEGLVSFLALNTRPRFRPVNSEVAATSCYVLCSPHFLHRRPFCSK